MINNFKLLIWDFDGVIADSEKVWLKNRQVYFKDRLGLDLSFDEINSYFGGTSDSTKKIILQKMGYETDDKFWADVLDIDLKSMDTEGLGLFDGVLEILKNKNFKQCIATGGIRSKTIHKIDVIGIRGLIPDEHIFTVDCVKRGKPEPDLFLYAADKMGEKPQDCLVIEDSIAGMTAAIRAKMSVVAFLGSEIYQHQAYIDKVKALGIQNIFYSMNELKQFLFDKK